MQTNIEEFFKTKKLPPWLVEHAVFKSINKVDKIFPRIGLPNCIEPCLFENVESARVSGEALISQLREYVQASDYHLTAKDWSQPNLINLHDCLQQLLELMANPASFINKKGSKVSLNLPEQIVGSDNKVIYRKGEGFFRVYNSLAEELATLRRGAKLRKLEKVALFKAFSSVNLPADKFSIAFSSDGVDGLWDIATMSMRGITSCQRWQGQHKHCLIGSIVDPFTAVIYLTSGTNYKHLGPKMIRRSVVRFVIDNIDKKPYILIDRVYPSHDDSAARKFSEFITKKTNGKFKVVYGPDMAHELKKNSYIPKFSAGDVLSKFHNVNLFSYQDTKVPIGKILDQREILRAANLKTRQYNFITRLNHVSATLTFTKDNVKLKETESEEFREFFTKLILGPDFRYHAIDFMKRIGAKLTADCQPIQMENPDDYTRRLCYFYFLNKKSILKAEKAAFIRRMSSYYTPKHNCYRFKKNGALIKITAKEKQLKLKTVHFNPIMEHLESEISKAIKNYAVETLKKSGHHN